MDIKTSVKNRREARIRELLESQQSPMLADKPWPAIPERTSVNSNVKKTGFVQDDPAKPSDRYVENEPDPERLWKQGHRGWYDTPNPGDPGEPPRKASFVPGLVRRITVSVLVFGLVWGVFSFQQPWALRTQAVIIEGLSHEMDFQAAQVWYEEHFGSAPSFIPIFGQTDENSTKVNARTSLVPPLAGRLVQSFAVDLKGIVLEAEGGSLADRAVKSIETGRVLEVNEHPQNGITVLIQHTGERTALYSRLAETGLKVNDWVQGGDIIGTLGTSGTGSAPSLYFELKEGDRDVDPAEVIPFD
ncbi:M23 family peptidase [Paenibacillus glucanolyticus]|jgi:stage IV sporulation protein FA|uniref:M23 family metallopeptidase n=1 Tax=Paenibacillus TaxID=44249 RepID=UPI0003E1BEB6|nr:MULTISPECIES: M23 family metallopeptidase [Paenibacillus]ANA81424.1 peptidase M23 [Paenibacillus glucanolyticus]AVV59846.1 M23 family peptidase [Paenibacillus glucanolyticus]AWP29101.1 peptidase M23 [Paenibacillus sp. Cedars]ETT35663.1 peptidase M23 [Paenibacillus sp. FSL R5-808]MPY20470.1 M23 family metallopeptidase [Paenibacillus glucanolyticus]